MKVAYKIEGKTKFRMFEVHLQIGGKIGPCLHTFNAFSQEMKPDGGLELQSILRDLAQIKLFTIL